MPLPWVRLDTTFPTNQKLLAMLQEKDGYRAAFLYVCSLSHSGAQGSDGFITREALPYIHGRPKDVALLVQYGFWRDQPGGWLINGWAEFQESNEETQARRVRAQAGAAARWKDHEPTEGKERTRQWRERQRTGPVGVPRDDAV